MSGDDADDADDDKVVAKLVLLTCPLGHVHNYLVWTKLAVRRYDGAKLTYCPDEERADDEEDQDD